MAEITDSEWVQASMMLPTHAVEQIRNDPKIYTSASIKYNDTTLGGNKVINPPPQFTRHADPKQKGTWSESLGMGRYYSEAIDDNNQIIHMRFGVAQFNSLTSFFTQFYDYRASKVASEGRAPGFFFNLGRAAGFVITAPILPFIFIGKLYRFFTNNPTSRYYYLKPSMATYWSAANQIANNIAINMGMVPRVLGGADKGPETGEKTREEIEKFDVGQLPEGLDPWTSGDIQKYAEAFPEEGIFKEEGGIDLHKIALRGQRLADDARNKYIESMANAGSDFDGLRESMKGTLESMSVKDNPQFGGINEYYDKWTKTGLHKEQGTSEEDNASKENIKENEKQGVFGDFADFSESALKHGAEFVSFRVNHTGTVSESMSNQSGQSELAQKINSTSASMRSKRFTFADGNLADIPLVGDIVNMASDVIGGLADSFQVSGLAALFGNAFAEIPEVWQDSQADLPEMSYSIHLRSPYGNKMSRFMNLVVPLSLLLTGALPKSHGKHAWGSPFLVELYDKGRAQTRLGLIDSLNITRGVGNIGWTQDHEPLGIDVDITVKDLSAVMHMPINQSVGVFSEQSVYNDYMAILGSLSMSDQIYPLRRIQMNLTRKMVKFRTHWASPAQYALWASDTTPGRVLGAIVRNTSSTPPPDNQ